MAFNPGVSFFIPFHELDPSEQSRCIFFTREGARCKCLCQKSDNRRAIALHKTIIEIPSGAVSLDLLQEYAQCNCCRFGRAQHRDRIEDVGLLMPLARRWQDEIRRHARTSFGINATPSKPASRSSSYQYSPPRSSTATEPIFQPFGSQLRYKLRPREANISTNSTSTRPTPISQEPLSEFRPHVANPRRSDSVSWKIIDDLEDRDFETGSLYIFDRASSPGHVKIGWTASSVSRRLEDWSKCDYKPNLLFSVRRVPHAQRVETLTHHELIKEWRRERMCKAPRCGISHREWFEISKERAAQVLGDWADFMKRAEPYDSEGSLKKRWRKVIKMMDEDGEVVTAEKLLERYEASLAKKATLVGRPADLGYVPKIGRLEAPKETTRVGLLRIEQPTSPNKTPPLKSKALPKQIPQVENRIPKAEKYPKSDPPPKRKPLPKTEQIFKSEPVPRTQLPFKTEPSSEEVLVQDLAKKIQLLLSQLESRIFQQDTLSPQETKPRSILLLIPHPTQDRLIGLALGPSFTLGHSLTLSHTSEDIPQTNARAGTDIDIGVSTNSSLLDFSDPSSEPHPSDSSAQSASPRPKAELVSGPPASLITGISEALLSLSTDEQEEVARTLA
ncbi:uncharacterized protein PAC_19523 [Phialocephala subalpina]|uniref:Bacteriophage T5 Orf172 DNA-binding domain-containing protein n=1 Tax=Phialocephala subalpina TaxID=576137 RepID=A0A1L7XX47_9HELO|nr:uncharacterized protein PAC_19523 [Phialocephala subalpina]